jgi:hypothetical protein
VFAVANVAVALARALGGALAFPLVVEGGRPGLAMAALVLPTLVLAATARPVWAALRR